jgi:hypothetical protein
VNLIRPTRRILIFLRACIRDVQHVLEQFGDSSQAGNKTERRSNEPVQVRAVVAFDDKARQDTKAEAERQYRAQNSIKNATWCAFLAAIVYAGIAAYQASEMRKATKAAQESADAATKQLEMIDRAWIKVNYGR